VAAEVGVVGVEARASLADPFRCDDVPFVGDAVGVVCRRGEGETGDSGRRKGELRGELPYPSGEGLYPAGID